MGNDKIISGFSRMERKDKTDLLLRGLKEPDRAGKLIESYRHSDPGVQKLHDEFSENTVTNFYLPYGIAPNFLINGKIYMVPMVTEESSVVAAAARSAKFWSARGGFTTTVKEFVKNGQVHFIWKGDAGRLRTAFPDLRDRLIRGTEDITSNMVKRGGGITNIELVDKSDKIEGYFQISAGFDTRDSMGANFINSCLEEFAVILREFLATDTRFDEGERDVNIIMSILSNYSDKCLVTASVSCNIEDLAEIAGDMPAGEFAGKFYQAVQIAGVDVYRATTHNKGIFNGIDAVVIATGNDFRAVEAAGHAWAAREGNYKSLSAASVENGRFNLSLTLPVAVGTVGGLTGLHPMAGLSLEILGNPDAKELMGIIAAGGLASNFAAVSSLVTKGIQSGHMKMHLSNILNHFGASDIERRAAAEFFSDRKVGFAAVEGFLNRFRKGEG
ncbi:MAG: hydroxymethylglutaryl-CoA reductase [Bacteroidales bacterium]